MRGVLFLFLALICLCTAASAAYYALPGTIAKANASKTATIVSQNQSNATPNVSIVSAIAIQPMNYSALTAPNATATGNQTNKTSTIPARAAVGAARTVLALNTSNAGIRTITPPSTDRVVRGPVDPGALEDNDNDSVINMLDQCPATPPGALVYDNGCRCKDSEAGWDKYYQGTVEYREKVPHIDVGGTTGGDKNKTGIGYTITNYFADDSCSYTGSTSFVQEKYCNPAYETGASDEPVASIGFPCMFGCSDGKCNRVYSCASSSGGTCADGIMNQDETGVDCGGKCAPCNTHCTTGTKYAPSDTPCTANYNTDPYRVNYTWTDSDLEYECRWYEVCHTDLDFVIDEAQQCCSVTSEEGLGSMPDPALCKDAIDLGGGNCRKCTGMYIIKGMGTYARWMQGYQELDTLYTSPTPTAEHLINDYKIGVCRDYSLATATLLRKAGYSQEDVGNTCDGAHCYDVVRFPGDAKWHVVDTTGNSFDVNPGGLPQSGYPYCRNLNESKWCFMVNKTGGSLTGAYYTHLIPDVAAYWSVVDSGGAYAYPRATSCSGTMLRDFAPMCGPGVACGKDSYRIPDFAPSINDIVGCS